MNEKKTPNEGGGFRFNRRRGNKKNINEAKSAENNAVQAEKPKEQSAIQQNKPREQNLQHNQNQTRQPQSHQANLPRQTPQAIPPSTQNNNNQQRRSENKRPFFERKDNHLDSQIKTLKQNYNQRSEQKNKPEQTKPEQQKPDQSKSEPQKRTEQTRQNNNQPNKTNFQLQNQRNQQKKPDNQPPQKSERKPFQLNQNRPQTQAKKLPEQSAPQVSSAPVQANPAQSPTEIKPQRAETAAHGRQSEPQKSQIENRNRGNRRNFQNDRRQQKFSQRENEKELSEAVSEAKDLERIAESPAVAPSGSFGGQPPRLSARIARPALYIPDTGKNDIPSVNSTAEETAAAEVLQPEPSPAIQPEPVDDSEKIEIVGVRFKPVGKIYFFAPSGMKFENNEQVIVETSRGIELGFVVIKNRLVMPDKVVMPLKTVQRRASEADIERVENNRILAKEAMRVANERIKTHKINLKLIEAEYTFDNSKLLYYFIAESRIDFRELVKDLAAVFKVRIELRQIGIRDQTKILGGLSICGRPFCCNSFLQDFEQVTIKMAKEQGISINSAKISGACGRLMCCLRYEYETYEALHREALKVNSVVETTGNETGVITDSNILTGICKVKMNNKGADQQDVIKSFHKKELKVIGFVNIPEKKEPEAEVLPAERPAQHQ